MYRLYLLFASLRIILTVIPQTGYIHPDEYFQSIEVIAANAFNVEVNKPWEFNATFPIRSAAPAYLIVGTSFQVLKFIDTILTTHFRFTILSTYSILLCARLMMCFLSFLVDWSLYKICSTNSEKYQSRCLILSVSYIMTTYATRTFSNTIELVLFALLLYFVSESLIFTTINVRQREYINIRYNKAKSVVEKAKFHKLKLFLQDDSLKNCLVIATLTTFGVFNRPTFLAYAGAPVFFWLYRGIGFKSVNTLTFHLRTLAFLLCVLPILILFIVIDSLYFGYLTWGEVGMFQVTIDNFVVTPFNFIKYNINPTNLAQHGLHPKYLHAAVNIPLLFNILGVIAYFNLMELFSHLLQTKYHYLPTTRSIRGLMTASFLIPLGMLSIFPHQEPRFLIPLILPLVYLYGAQIYPEINESIVKSFLAEEKPQVEKKTNSSYFIFKVWIVINVFLTIFYGFIHQGGVYSMTSDLSKEMSRVSFRTNYHIVTSHVYMLPKSLFLVKQPSKRYLSRVGLFLHEEGSKDFDMVFTKIEKILHLCDANKVINGKTWRCKVHLIIPSSLVPDIYFHIYKPGHNLDFSSYKAYYPHLSIEALPNINCLNDLENFLMYPTASILKILKCFGLARIEFTLKHR